MLKLRNSLIINMIPSPWENTVVMQKIEIMAFLEALFLHLAYLIERFYYVNDIFLSKYYRLFHR